MDIVDALRNPLLVTDQRFELAQQAAAEIENLEAEVWRLRGLVLNSMEICEDWAERLFRMHKDNPTEVVDREWCAQRFRAARNEIEKSARRIRSDVAPDVADPAPIAGKEG